MGRVGSIAVLAFLVSACAPTVQERVAQFNDLGVQSFQKGEFDRARQDFQVALQWLPNDFTLLYNIAQCYDRLGQADRAEQFYRLCLQQNPNEAECRHALNVLLVQRGRGAEAQRMVQDWLAHQPKLSAPYAEDGWLFQREGNPTAAMKRYQEAINIDPHNTMALVGMGQIYEEAFRLPSRALKLYQIALDYDPHQPELVKRVNLLRSQNVGPPHPEF